jgi:large subunit ribosomal protein L9
MRIILRETVPTLGNAGEVKNVADGYARNFLFPRGLADPASESNLRTLNQRLAERTAAEAKGRAGFQTLAGKLSQTALRFALKIGAAGKTFGSITAQDIADELAAQGFAVKKNWIELEHGLKAVGEHSVKVRFPHQIEAEIKVIVETEGR